MKRNPKQLGDDENGAVLLCLRAVEQRMELLQGCLHGKETVERPSLLLHIQKMQKQDAAMLAAVDNDIAKPNVVAPMSGESNWTAEKVKAIFCNPLYIGHPTSEEEWIRGAIKMMKEDGREQFLVNLVSVLRQTGLVGESPAVRQDGGPIPCGFSESQKESFPGFGAAGMN